MENRAHAIATGLFALFLGSILVVCLWWFSDEREQTRDYLLVSNGSVNGLNVQARVRYRGISAGSVTDIGIDPTNPRQILVRIRIRADLPVTTRTRASLGTQGVTGLAYVQLDESGDGGEPFASNGDELPRIALEAALMDQIADNALAAAMRFKQVADRVATLFNDENALRLSTSIARLEAAVSGIDATFRDAPKTLAAIRMVFSDENLATLSTTLKNLERTSAVAEPTIVEMRNLLAQAAEMSARIDRTAGAAGDTLIDGTLPHLNELLQDLTLTSRRLGRLIEEVETTPQILLTGPAARLPGPGEEGFKAR
ncbi:MCE family protein [Azoarcus sp. L1K30]|uniref:MlaD family protein n=1 Tax=Azoarcus sp. L1K30 TaxID=2820277 RepID=UPI001B826ED3|nr:MlaD family protein [Azoarcus sp. L1K30]MBR0565277.1 MCE family protein [Azoarcus sp. L1K30]